MRRFITFHAAFYDLQFAAVVVQSFLWMLLYGWPLTAYNYNVNYKGP